MIWRILITLLCVNLFLSISVSAQNSKDLESLCEKYVIDCPISITRSSNWVDIAVVNELLRDYLIHKKNSIRKTNQEVEILGVDFDGDKIIVWVNHYKFIVSEEKIVPLGSNQTQADPKEELAKQKAREKELEQKFLLQVTSMLYPVFSQSKPIEIKYNNPTVGHMIFIIARDLKQKYIKYNNKINYDAVWMEIINSLSKVDGFIADSKSEVIGADSKENSILFKDNYRKKISTLPNVVQNKGLVNKCFLTVEINGNDPILGTYFSIELLIKIHRRRASSNKWSEVFVGDSINNLSQISVFPVANKIMEALKR